MGGLEQMPLPSEEDNEEEIKQKLYFEFTDGQVRHDALEVINQLRDTNPQVFEGLHSIKVDSERSFQGLEFAFESDIPERTDMLLELLHQNGVKLNLKNGQEEEIYEVKPKKAA